MAPAWLLRLQPGYNTVVAGTMLVAVSTLATESPCPTVPSTNCLQVAQPFFQCTPPLLSATWFAPDETPPKSGSFGSQIRGGHERAEERAMSTAVAINFNQAIT